MRALVGIAQAIEHESAARYEQLADRMARQGEAATAAAFRVLLEEERKHVDAVAHWAVGLGQPLSAPDVHAGQLLPEELSSSWADVAGSALLTPYRAFALAVENEQRAFQFYIYLAARAEEPHVRAEAEKLAAEELHHAALLRRFRRRAWHRERGPARPPDHPIASREALDDLIVSREAQIAREHEAIAQRLRQLGDEPSARLLEALARAPAAAPGQQQQRSAPAAASAHDDAVHLLVDAQKPLEAFSETLERVLRTTHGELFAQTEAALVDVVQRLARISLRAGQRMQEKPSGAREHVAGAAH